MIFATLRKIIVTAFKAAYAIISFLYLQYALLVLLVGLILLITGVFSENQSIYVIFWVVLGLSVVLCVYLNLKRLAPQDKPKKRREVIYQLQAPQSLPNGEVDISFQQPVVQNAYVPVPEPIQEKPLRYFRVKQNPNYIVGEFSDRFEVYLVTQGGLKKIRADYK